MNKRGVGGLPMSERVRVTQARRTPGPVTPDCPARHCWVADAVDREGVKRPGLLLEWRQGRAGWEGRVVYVARLRADRWVAVEEWLPAELLTER